MAQIPTDGSIEVSIPQQNDSLIFDKMSGSMVLKSELLQDRCDNEDWFREQD